jgi:transmembrane sensor
MNMDERITDRSSWVGSHDGAEQWFVRLLEPGCPADVRTAFERWRDADPAHAAAYREIERLWKQGEEAVKDPAIMAAANRALRRPKPRFPHHWFLFAALSALAAMVMLTVMPRWLGRSTGKHYATVVGQQQTVSLRDGSSIFLDTDTEVVEHYSASERHIDLLHGRAQFKVQGNPAWPFVVHVQSGTVTAIGTEFQVGTNDDATSVILLKGKLAIATTSLDGTPQAVSLVAGQQVMFNQAGKIDPIHPADLQAAEVWTTGKLFVDDWSLPVLLTEMNRYSVTQLQIGDPSLQNIHISGVFRAGDQEALILALQRGWPIRAHRVSPTQIVLLHSK